MARAYEGLMEIYFITDRPVPCLYSVFRSLNYAERAGASPELARCYSSTAALVGFLRMRKVANLYFSLAADVARRTVDPAAEAWVAMALGFYLTGVGNQAGAREQLLRSMDINGRLGDSTHRDVAAATLAGSCYLHSDFTASQELAERVYSSALLRRDVRTQAEGVRWRAYNLIALNRLKEAQSAVVELDTLRSSTMNLGGAHRKQDVATLNGLLNLKRGSYQTALEHAQDAMRKISGVKEVFDFLLERAGIAEIYLTLWECDQLPTRQLQSEAATAVKAVGKYASIFPVGRPAALFWMGRLLWLRGSYNKALKYWRQSCSAAESLHIPLYEALAHHELGRHLPEDDPSRESHLSRARTILESLEQPPGATIPQPVSAAQAGAQS
jgi:tetratricopeptide (TPR) repeat protein